MVTKEKMINLASQCLGLHHKKPYNKNGKYFYAPYRNYFISDEEDIATWNELCCQGYAKKGVEELKKGHIFWLTKEGIEWLEKQLKINIHVMD